ncbi:hypothetical protein KJ853_03385 [Patescibacteria group bacterium]|nr:hypothetical protein [Patescibacteria group bacterium]
MHKETKNIFKAVSLIISLLYLMIPLSSGAVLVGNTDNATLSLSPQLSIYRVGPTFTVDITVNTHGQGVDTVAAYINYNTALFAVDVIDYTGSPFTMQAESSTSTPVGMIKITRGVPAPTTVNSTNAKIATLYMRGLGNTTPSADNFNFDFVAGDAGRSAVFMAGTYVLSGVYNAQYTLDGTPPANVSSFTATAGDGQISLSWTNPTTDFAGVTILRKTGSYPTSPTDGTIIYDNNGTSYVNTGLTNGTTYYYKAFSRDIVLNYSSGAQISAIPRDTNAPSPINTLSATALTARTVRLNWTATGDDGSAGTAASYDIRYSTSAITAANFASATQVSGAPAPQISGSAETMTVAGLSGNTTYYFAIKASDESANISSISNVANAITYKTADLNNNGIVNAQDFSILMSYWGSTNRPVADINQDGYVNAQDFSIMMSQWG